jgi:hypothetical protein
MDRWLLVLLRHQTDQLWRHCCLPGSQSRNLLLLLLRTRREQPRGCCQPLVLLR